MDCEYSQIGYGSLGWTVPGGGGVVPFYVPGQPNESSWAQIFAGAPRTFANVDYVFVLHATNDGLRAKGTPASVAAVTASVHAWLGDVRAAVGAATRVFLTVPFGSFGAAQAPVGALAAGFHAYQTTAPDSHAHYIDLGPTAARGTRLCVERAVTTVQRLLMAVVVVAVLWWLRKRINRSVGVCA